MGGPIIVLFHMYNHYSLCEPGRLAQVVNGPTQVEVRFQKAGKHFTGLPTLVLRHGAKRVAVQRLHTFTALFHVFAVRALRFRAGLQACRNFVLTLQNLLLQAGANGIKEW